MGNMTIEYNEKLLKRFPYVGELWKYKDSNDIFMRILEKGYPSGLTNPPARSVNLSTGIVMVHDHEMSQNIIILKGNLLTTPE